MKKQTMYEQHVQEMKKLNSENRAVVIKADNMRQVSSSVFMFKKESGLDLKAFNNKGKFTVMLVDPQ